VYTDDVDQAVAELRQAGVPVLFEPTDQPWDERAAYVTDPDGNPILIVAPSPVPAAPAQP
jgi:lactoylglutathione lyase